MSRRSKTPRIAPRHEKHGIDIGPTNTSFGRTITIVNPTSANDSYYKHRYVLWFGHCGATYLLVNEDSLDSALDEAIDWIVDHAPGLLCDEQVEEAYHEALASGMSEEEAMEEAESDTECGGNAGNHILSYEWGIIAEDPTRAELDELLYDPRVHWPERTQCADDHSRWHRCNRRRDPSHRMYDAALPVSSACATA